MSNGTGGGGGEMPKYCPPGCDPEICKAMYTQYAALWNACGDTACRQAVYEQYIAAVEKACGGS